MMKLLVLGLLTLNLAVPTIPQQKDTPRQESKPILCAIPREPSDQRYKEKKKCLDDVTDHPDSPEAHYRLGRKYLEEPAFEGRATESFLKAIQLNANYYEAYSGLGNELLDGEWAFGRCNLSFQDGSHPRRREGV